MAMPTEKVAWMRKSNTAIASRESGAVGAGVQQDSYRLQHLVASRVAVSVIEVFEVVYIDQHQAQGLALALATGQLSAQRVIQVAPVVHAGQCVAIGLHVELSLQCVGVAQPQAKSFVGFLQGLLPPAQLGAGLVEFEVATIDRMIHRYLVRDQPQQADHANGPAHVGHSAFCAGVSGVVNAGGYTHRKANLHRGALVGSPKAKHQ